MSPTSDADLHGVYGAITDVRDDARWAFGTGFHAPSVEITAPAPDGVDVPALAHYCRDLGDDALIMSQRLQQWLTRAPELEEETALANIALDLLGQATHLYERAAWVEGVGRSADDLAFRRPAAEFGNVELAEWADADFAALVARLLLFSAWRLAVFARLRGSRDTGLAAIAASGAKELTYHRDYAAQWVIRLGDGTEYSAERAAAAMAALGGGLAELFTASPAEQALVGVAVDPGQTRTEVSAVLADVCALARLAVPTPDRPTPDRPAPRHRGDAHTAGFADLLDELQSVARAHPGATW